jgi:hypothetical protein
MVQPAGSVALIFECPIAEFTKAIKIKEYCPCQGVDSIPNVFGIPIHDLEADDRNQCPCLVKTFVVSLSRSSTNRLSSYSESGRLQGVTRQLSLIVVDENQDTNAGIRPPILR